MFLTDQRCFSRICFALSQLGFNIPPGFNIPLGFNIPVGSQVYRKIPVEIPLGFNIPAGSHRDFISQWDPGGIPSGSKFFFHLGDAGSEPTYAGKIRVPPPPPPPLGLRRYRITAATSEVIPSQVKIIGSARIRTQSSCVTVDRSNHDVAKELTQ